MMITVLQIARLPNIKVALILLMFCTSDFCCHTEVKIVFQSGCIGITMLRISLRHLLGLPLASSLQRKRYGCGKVYTTLLNLFLLF